MTAMGEELERLRRCGEWPLAYDGAGLERRFCLSHDRPAQR